MNGYQIPHFGLARQYKNIGTELLQASHDVLKTGVLVNGYFTNKLEKWLQQRTNTSFAITCHSGTQALEIIARYMAIKLNLKNPTVCVPNLTYPATINSWIISGYNIEIVDTDKFGIIDYDLLDQSNANLVCLVGLYGKLPEYKQLITGHSLIVDGAQHWLTVKNSYDAGWAMAISFDPTKNLNASGNGGAIVTNDVMLHQYAINYTKNGKPEFEIAGTNSQLSEQDAAHIIVRAAYIDQWQERRKKIAAHYNENLINLPIESLCQTSEKHAYQKYVIYLQNRNSLKEHLEESGIETKISYPETICELPAYQQYKNPSMVSTSVMLSRGVLSLPIYPELTDNEVEYVVKSVKQFYK